MTKTAMLVLQDFLSFVQWDGKPSYKGERATKPRMVNGDSLRYSYGEAERRGIPKNSFTRALSEIVHHGFLTVSHHGAGLQGDASVYAWSETWRTWAPAEKVTPRRRGRPFGDAPPR